MSDRDLVLTIVDRLAIGIASDEDRDLLNAALQRDPRCLETYARAMRQQRLLRSLLAGAAEADAAEDGVPALRPSRRLIRRRARRHAASIGPWALAASLLVVVGAVVWLARAPAAGARSDAVVVIAGSGHAGTRPLAKDDVVTSGTLISAGGGGLELRAGDGSRIALASGARFGLQDDDAAAFAADLVAGSAHFTVRTQSRERRYAITTPQAVATVRGTAFTLTIADGATRIAVSEGLVGFQRRADGWTIDVAAGEEATTAMPMADKPATAPAGTIWRINLGGPPLVIDGVVWNGHDEAVRRGMRCTATLRASPQYDLTAMAVQPEADPGTLSLLATTVWDRSPTWTLALPVTPGDYAIRLWVAENHPLNQGNRRFDVLAEDRTLFTGIGTLAQGGWTIEGPAPVTVRDGMLDLTCVARQHEAHLMAIEVLPVSR